MSRARRDYLPSSPTGLTDSATRSSVTIGQNLTADKTYQSQMDAFFGAKAPDKSRISQFHNSKVDTMAQRIVKQTIENRYPDYAKRAAVAAKPGAPVAPKPGAEQPVAGKPEFV